MSRNEADKIAPDIDEFKKKAALKKKKRAELTKAKAIVTKEISDIKTERKKFNDQSAMLKDRLLQE